MSKFQIDDYIKAKHRMYLIDTDNRLLPYPEASGFVRMIVETPGDSFDEDRWGGFVFGESEDGFTDQYGIFREWDEIETLYVAETPGGERFEIVQIDTEPATHPAAHLQRSPDL